MKCEANLPGKKSTKKTQGSNIREDVQDLLRKTFPDGIVESVGQDESNLAELLPKLRAKLGKLRGATRCYERQAEPERRWDDDEEDFDKEPDPDSDFSPSYHLFFLALNDTQFTFSCDDKGYDEDGELRDVEGTGHIGCALGVSELAPVAIICFTQMEQYEDGSFSTPDVQDCFFSLDGKPINLEEHFRETHGDAAVGSLKTLQGQIAKIVESLNLLLLPEEEARKAVEWLEADEEVLAGGGIRGDKITVRDAFFHRRM